MKFQAIIVAGGQGERMKSSIPKQFIELDDKPIIAHTIQRFLQFDPSINMVVVLPSDQMETWEEISEKYFKGINIQIAKGGKTRTASVRSGLSLIADEGLVAIHDAVRPFVSIKTITDSFNSAEIHGSGVAVVNLKDSIREVNSLGSIAKDRNNYRLVQTPQTFNVSDLKNAYLKMPKMDFSDDASLFEAAGYSVHLIDGSYENIKITTPEDLP